jgi:hypothetical protein
MFSLAGEGGLRVRGWSPCPYAAAGEQQVQALTSMCRRATTCEQQHTSSRCRRAVACEQQHASNMQSMWEGIRMRAVERESSRSRREPHARQARPFGRLSASHTYLIKKKEWNHHISYRRQTKQMLISILNKNHLLLVIYSPLSIEQPRLSNKMGKRTAKPSVHRYSSKTCTSRTQSNIRVKLCTCFINTHVTMMFG